MIDSILLLLCIYIPIAVIDISGLVSDKSIERLYLSLAFVGIVLYIFN